MSAPDEETVEPASDSDKDRVITWRAAMLALIAALVAAFIGAGASYLTARVQVDSQAKQARTDFLRTQRQVAYAKLSADVRGDRQFFSNCISGLNTALTGVDKTTIVSVNSQSEAKAQQIAVDAAGVRFIGSSRVANLALQIAGEHELMATSCSAVTVSRLKGLPVDKAFSDREEKDFLSAESDEDQYLDLFESYGAFDVQNS